MRHFDLRARTRGLSVKTLICAVALVPLSAIGWLAGSASWKVAEDRDVAQDVRERVAEISTLVEIRAQLSSEQINATAIAEVRRMGISPSLASGMLGTDLEGNVATARKAIDDLLASDRHPAVRNAVAISRAEGGDRFVLDQRMAQAFATLDSELDQAGAELARAASRISAGAAVVTGADALVSATELHRTVTELHECLMSRATPEGSGPDALVTSTVILGRWQSGIDRLSRLSQGDPRLSGAIVQARDSTALRYLIDQATTMPEPIGTELTSEEIRAMAGPVTATFRNGSVARSQHLGVVKAALAHVDAEAVRLDDAVRRSHTRTIVLVTVMVLLTVLALGLVAGAIVRPLRRLASAGASLRDGDLDVHVALDGPQEIAATAAALNDAAAGLRLTEAQAGALATGALDDPVLSMHTPGRLGESLRKAVVNLARSLNEREDYRLRLSHEASHDGLTGLVNRAAAQDHLRGAVGRAVREGHTLTVLFCDLDGFKPINDLHGHGAGDDVLRTVARRFRDAVRPTDLVGRLGGDEFVVIAEGLGSPEEAVALGNRLVAAMSFPFASGTQSLKVGLSVGIRWCGPGDPVWVMSPATAVTELLRDADAAVYRAKGAGRGRAELFTEDLHRELRARLELEQALRVAVTADDGQLSLVYQPVVDADTGRHVGAEALLRWNRPGHGPVGPAEFIPVAERSELIIDLDAWVLRQAAAQLARWTPESGQGDRWLAVNLSGIHVCRPVVVEHVLGALRASGADPRRLVVEVTEQALLVDLALAADNLTVLRSHGVKVAVDDFGTGFTSLTHLRSLPIDTLKIDRSFVANLDSPSDWSLVRLVIETGHVLGVAITAEGVETPDQLRSLQSLGADHVQGYLTGRPMPAGALPVPAATAAPLAPPALAVATGAVIGATSPQGAAGVPVS